MATGAFLHKVEVYTPGLMQRPPSNRYRFGLERRRCVYHIGMTDLFIADWLARSVVTPKRGPGHGSMDCHSPFAQ